MEPLLDDLRGTVVQLRAVASRGLRGGVIRHASDASLVEGITLAGEALRLVDALLVESSGEVLRRSRSLERDQRLTSRMGCHDVNELLQRLTRLAPASASRLQRGARAVLVEQRLDGEPIPARLPAMRDALIDGQVGLDGLLAVAAPLEAMGDRVDVRDLLAADAVLAAEARGEGPDAAPPACAELLRVQAQAWSAALDQDGAEPREDFALARRGIRLGRARDGVVPISGALLPEVAAQLQQICHATGSPRKAEKGVAFGPPSTDLAGEDAFAPDPRTTAQKHHDALATALFTAASSRLLPTVGGAAPTLVVSVRAEDLVGETGWAMVHGVDEPVSTAAARHAGCAGVIQRVLLGRNGRILRLGTEERVFNKHQRRAIALVVRPQPAMATRHEIPHPPARPRHPTHMNRRRTTGRGAIASSGDDHRAPHRRRPPRLARAVARLPRVLRSIRPRRGDRFDLRAPRRGRRAARRDRAR